MAVNKSITKRALVLSFADGVDGNGMTKLKAFSFPNVKPEAAVENIVAAATALANA